MTWVHPGLDTVGRPW